MSKNTTEGVEKRTQSIYKLTPEEEKKCHTIIHSASVAATTVGAGLAQLPLADNAVITPIQITMIISLGKVFGQTVTKSVARGLLGGFVANFVGRGVAQAVWGWIPGVGNVTNAATAAAITETIGWLSVDHFYKSKYIDDAQREKDDKNPYDPYEKGKQEEISDEELHSLGFCKIVKKCEVIKDESMGYLIWDCAIENEISFVNQNKIESLYRGWSDEKTEEKFEELALKYAVKDQEDKPNAQNQETVAEASWENRAEEFISGTKSKIENWEDYQKLLDEYDDMSYMCADENNEFASVYEKLLSVK